jgi:hypothetical protein
MKKIIVSLIVAGVIVAALGSVAVVSAQGPVNQSGTGQTAGQGGGRYGNRVSDDLHVENEAVHDLMMSAYAVKLGLSVDELNTREEAGETLSQIALSTGLSFEEFWAMKTEIKTQVTSQALAEGLITQAEADLMLQSAARRAARFSNSNATGSGTGYGMGGRMGSGMRGTGFNSASCTNLP